jgi:hypothetical protein
MLVAQTAHGSDNGTDTANAHSVLWFNNAGNRGVGANKIGAGDTVHLCGILTAPLTINGSGSSGNVITIYFEPDAKISQPYFTGNYNSAIFAVYRSYIKIDGGTNGTLECTDNGAGPGSTPAGTANNQVDAVGIRLIGPGNNVEICHLHIGPLYYWPAANNDPNAFGTAISCSDYSKLYLHDNIIHDAKNSIGDYASQNSTIDDLRYYNNTITRVSQGPMVGVSQASPNIGGVTNVLCYNNSYNDNTNWDGEFSGDHHHHGGAALLRGNSRGRYCGDQDLSLSILPVSPSKHPLR